jgi:hypothetical protein
MVGDGPDPERFASVIGGALAAGARWGGRATVRAHGEMVDVLWRDGNQRGALELEGMSNRIFGVAATPLGDAAKVRDLSTLFLSFP